MKEEGELEEGGWLKEAGDLEEEEEGEGEL